MIRKYNLLVSTMLSTMVLLQPAAAPARDDGTIRLAQNPPPAATPENESDKQKQRPGQQRQERKQEQKQQQPQGAQPPAQQRVQPTQPPAQPKPPQQAQPAAPHPPQPPTAAQPPQRPTTVQQPAPPPAAQQQQQAQPPASAQPPDQRRRPTAQDQQQRQDQRQQRPGQAPGQAPTAQQPTPPQPPTAGQPPQRPTVQQPVPPAPTQQAQPPASAQPPGQRPAPTAQQPVPAPTQQQQAQPPASVQQPGQRPAPTAQQPIQTPPGAQQLPVPGAPQQAARPAPTTPPAPSALQTLQPQAPAAGPQGQAAAPAFNRTGRIDDVRRDRREVREGDRNIIQEAGRVIIQEGGRAIIRHNEVERFRDGARDVRVERHGNETVTVIERPNGVRIVTVTDEYGRLVRRTRRGPDGRDFVLIDNRYRGPAVVGSYYVDLPPPVIRIPRERYIVEAERASREEIYAALMAPPVERIDRRYTLDEIRYSPRLLERMPRVDLDTVNFESGSWQLTPDQVGRLQVIADGIKQALTQNPGEVFLIQGHTDAVGGDVDNLSLSDRRAESVALALSEQFQVPAENLTTQGYGEQYLKVQTDGPERQNRRVTVQRITPLLGGEGQPGQPG